MVQHNCTTCSLRARFDTNSRSLLGRIWRWHITWCPGWRRYMESLPVDERKIVREKYELVEKERR